MSFRVVQWNILADGLAQCGGFLKVDPDSLLWNVRRDCLFTAMANADADIFCLEELNHFDDFFCPKFKELQFSGIFHEKRDSPAVKYGSPSDGCAIFFRDDHFSLSSFQRLDFGDENMKYNQGAIIAKLKDKQNDRSLIIAVTHLKAKPGTENAKIRALQISQLLSRIEEETDNGSIPCIIAGDWNSTPEENVYEAVKKHPFRFQNAYSNDTSCVRVSHESWKCTHDSGMDQPFSTWKFRSSGEKCQVIDYICYSNLPGSKLALQGCYCLPSKEAIGPSGLPTKQFPSDHLPLMVQFTWLP